MKKDTLGLISLFGDKSEFGSVTQWLCIVLGLFARIPVGEAVSLTYLDGNGVSRKAIATPIWWRYPLDKDGGAVTCQVVIDGEDVGRISLLRQDETEGVVPYFTIGFKPNSIDSILLFRALVNKVYTGFKTLDTAMETL